MSVFWDAGNVSERPFPASEGESSLLVATFAISSITTKDCFKFDVATESGMCVCTAFKGS